MSSTEDEDQFTEEQVKEIKRVSNLKKKEFAERFGVSGWEDDTEGIEEEKNPHAKPETEILWAAENGELELVKKLVALDPDLLKVKDKDGYTPLHRSCYNDHEQVTEVACKYPKTHIFIAHTKFLISAGSDIYATTNDLWQPLHSACKWNNPLCAAILLDAGADINCKSQGGQTPLHLAASNGEAKETLQLLLMHPNIKPDLLNDNNETAFDVAQRSGKYYSLFEISDPIINHI